MMYISDFEDYFPAVVRTGEGYWHNHYLAPYFKRPMGYYYYKYFECPSDRLVWTFNGSSSTIDPSYGYNDQLGYQNGWVKLARVRDPVFTVLCGETPHGSAEGTVYRSNVIRIVDWYGYNYPTVTMPYCSAMYPRHGLGANVLWVDGHVDFEKRIRELNRSHYFPSGTPYGKSVFDLN